MNDLPDEVLAEILKTLAVKYILRCRCVQKSWYYLIQTPTFITLHTNHQKITTDKYLLFETIYTNQLTLRFDDLQFEKYYLLEFHPDLPLDYHLHYIQSYGLMFVCSTGDLHVDDNIYYLWNPLIQKYKTLPDSPLRGRTWITCWNALAFGFVPEVNDYVVVQIVKYCWSKSETPSLSIGVYSLSTNSWKKIRVDIVCDWDIILYRDGVFANGAAFWIACKSEDIVICFDTKNDILREIPLPNWIGAQFSCFTSLHSFGQSIALFVMDYKSEDFDMWVLKQGAIYEFSWEKKVSFSLSENVGAQVLGVRNNGDPIFKKIYDLISYDVDNDEENDFVDTWNCAPYYDMMDSKEVYNYHRPFVIHPFVETLVLLNS